MCVCTNVYMRVHFVQNLQLLVVNFVYPNVNAYTVYYSFYSHNLFGFAAYRNVFRFRLIYIYDYSEENKSR